jgi:abortive infection bacteriophage resistance protein
MNNRIPDKPFKTYDEQVDLLINRYGLKIKNRPFAIAALQSLTYYDLINGYKECFMHKITDTNGNISYKYSGDIPLEFIYYFSLVDKDIQALLFKYSTIIENSFKSKMAYVISKNFGVFEDTYLSPDNYFKSHHNILLSDVLESCHNAYDESKGYKLQQPTNYYKHRHNHIPAWILFKNVSFSKIINLYQLLHRTEKVEVSKLILPSNAISYSTKAEFIIGALNLIRAFRNKIAHNLKFVTYKSRSRVKPDALLGILPKCLLTKKDTKKHALNDIYAYILCIYSLLGDDYLKKLSHLNY